MSSAGGWKSANPPVSPRKGRRVRDKVEISPTSRAECQMCGQKIAKGEMRVGIQAKIKVPGASFDPWRLKYYHDQCLSSATKEKLFLETPTAASKRLKQKSKAKTTRTSGATSRRTLKPKQRKELERRLRQLRRCFAEQQHCEEFKVFHNKTLHDIIANLPKNDRELRKCWGVGPKRLRQYGDSILQVISSVHRQDELSRVAAPASATQSQGAAVAAAAANASDDDIIVGPSLSVEGIVKQRMRDAEERGEVFEILD